MKKKIGVFIVITVLVCAISMPIFADTVPSYAYNINKSYEIACTDDSNYSLKTQISVTSYNPYLIQNEFEDTGSGTNRYYKSATYAQEFSVRIRLLNNSGKDIQIGNMPEVKLNINNSTAGLSYKGDSVSEFEGAIIGAFISGTDNSYNQSVKLVIDSQYYSGNWIVIPTNYYLQGTFKITRYFYSGGLSASTGLPTLNDLYISDATWVGLTNVTTSTRAIHLEEYNIYQIEQNTQAILDAYTSNSANAQAVTDGTQSNEQTLAGIGQNEDTWFTQNNQALQSTGITNFDYSPTVMTGMSAISDKFNQLWLAIGDWNFVYTFSMMIGLVMLILRHAPQRRKGGGKNASGT